MGVFKIYNKVGEAELSVEGIALTTTDETRVTANERGLGVDGELVIPNEAGIAGAPVGDIIVEFRLDKPQEDN